MATCINQTGKNTFLRRGHAAFISAVSIAALCAGAPAFADVKTGVDAWSAGDYTAAVAEWRGPAASGDTDALFNLAQAYRLGRGVTADIAKARELYLQAAQQGHIKAADNYGLLLFQQGEQAKAIPLIEAASNRGDPRAQYVMGLAHFNADYADKDWVRAYALLSLSQAAGLPQASKAIAQMDGFIPLAQRQEAQALAVTLKAAADQRLTAQLASADLGVTSSGPAAAAPRAPHRAPAASRSVSQDTPQERPQNAPPAAAQQRPTPRGLPPASRPVQQYRLPALAGATSPAAAAPSAPTAVASAAPKAARAPASPNGPWGLQLGAFGVSGNADKLWSKLASNPALSGTRKSLISSGRVTRLLAVGFASQSAAAKACSALKRQGQDCLVKKT